MTLHATVAELSNGNRHYTWCCAHHCALHDKITGTQLEFSDVSSAMCYYCSSIFCFMHVFMYDQCIFFMSKQEEKSGLWMLFFSDIVGCGLVVIKFSKALCLLSNDTITALNEFHQTTHPS